MCEILRFSRQYDQALNDARIKLKDFPDAPDLLTCLAQVYHRKGMDRESAEMLARLYGQPGEPNPAIMQAFAFRGYRGIAQWQLDRIERAAAKSVYVSPVELAHLHAELGERDETFSLLNRAYDGRDPMLLFIRTDPAYDFLHTDPRYSALIQRIGFWSSQ